jgi:hypothetical protein
MFIDLLGRASNLGHLRDEALIKAIPDLLKTYHRREPTPLEIVTVARRMSLSGAGDEFVAVQLRFSTVLDVRSD